MKERTFKCRERGLQGPFTKGLDVHISGRKKMKGQSYLGMLLLTLKGIIVVFHAKIKEFCVISIQCRKLLYIY